MDRSVSQYIFIFLSKRGRPGHVPNIAQGPGTLAGLKQIMLLLAGVGKHG